jgi:lipopolysaccharide export system permease protein
MKIFDRYIVKQFLASFLFGLVAFLFIFVIIDMMEKLDDFIDAGAPASVVLQYYIVFLPEILKLMTPVALLLGSLFVVGRLSSQGELAAMKSSGVSLYRLLVPFLGVALSVSLLLVYLNGWVVPLANQKKIAIERAHLQRGIDPSNRFNIFFQDGKTRIVSINYFDTPSKTANRVSVQDFADTNLTLMVQRIDATQMRWVDSAGGTWRALNGAKRNTADLGSAIQQFRELPIGRLSISPEDIEKKQRSPDEMILSELHDFIRNQQAAGQNVARWMVDYHAKISFPFACVIMVLFGVPFACARPRTGTAVGFGIAISVTFIYIGFFKGSQVFGYNGDLNPILTAWMANLLFGISGIVNLLRVQK